MSKGVARLNLERDFAAGGCGGADLAKDGDAVVLARLDEADFDGVVV